MSDSAKPSVRTQVVRSPSAMRETGWVAMAVFLILFFFGGTLGVKHAANAGPPSADVGFEAVFRDLAPDDQRMFRDCLAGLTEAEEARAKTGHWPAVEQLAARGIAPFAKSSLGYSWALRTDKNLVNYVGTPEDGTRPTFVIVVLEPDPGMEEDPTTPIDEQHHRLRNGPLVHVSVWMGSGAIERPMWTLPVEKGWRRITMVTP